MYDKLANNYDLIFPFNINKYNFLLKYISPTKVLDLACATGMYTNLLSKYYDIIGIDIDKTMIEYAITSYPNTNFITQDMQTLDYNKEFNTVLLLGNSLVHLNSIDAIRNQINLLFQSLKNDGILIMQNINYDYIYINNITNLPTIQNENITFTREYELQESNVIFKSTLNNKIQNQVNLYPLKYDQINEILLESGFNKIKVFGSYKEEKFYTDKSLHSIIIAYK